MIADEPMMPEAWVVRDATRELPDVVTLTLEAGEGARPRRFAAGQFNMLYAFGVGEVPISMSGDPEGGPALVHTIRDVGLVTRALCRARPGDLVGVRGPFGSAWPVASEAGRDLVIVAGGIGLAPLRPVLHEAMRHRGRFGAVALLYGARRPEDLLFRGELEAWRARGVQLDVTVDHAGPDWTGQVGVVTTLVRHARFRPREASALLCGPEVMMRFAAQELESRGVDAARISVSLERNMKCAVGFCGHCQLGPEFICMQGPVLPWPRVRGLMRIREL